MKFTFVIHDSFLFHVFTLSPFDYTEQHKKEVSIQSLAAGYLDVLRTTNILIFFSPSLHLKQILCSLVLQNTASCFALSLQKGSCTSRVVVFSIATRAGTSRLRSHVWVKYDSSKFYIFIKPYSESHTFFMAAWYQASDSSSPSIVCTVHTCMFVCTFGGGLDEDGWAQSHRVTDLLSYTL